MESAKKWIYLITAVFWIDICSSQETGKVYIGAIGNSPGFTNRTSYTFNLNAGRQQLPIYILITNSSDPSQNFPLRDTVDISCEASNTGPGFSAASFLSLAFAPSNPIFNPINFDLTGSGRTVEIRCYGISRGFTCPVNSSATTPQPQFCRSTSLSDPVTLTIQPAPVVSFCSPVITVPDAGTVRQSFSLTLSEPVKDFPVNIYCQIVNLGGLGFTITPPAPLQNGSSTVSVRYDITSRGSPSEVVCAANSQGGNQYLNATSTDSSSRSQFVLSTGTVQLLPEITPSYTTTFRGILTLDTGAETDDGITFECGPVVANNIDDALALMNNRTCDFPTSNVTTTGTSSTTQPTTVGTTATTDPNVTVESTTLPTTTPTPVDRSSTWLIDEPTFSFKKGQTYKTVVANRQRRVIAPVTELVVVTCCVLSSSPKYANMTTAMLTVNHLDPNICVNCTGGPTSGGAGSERTIQNVAFQEVAPCPCDLTHSVCDINCCCDQECSNSHRQTFSYCLPGPYGGQGYPTPFRKCHSNHTFKEDWFPFLCVMFETNAFLGLFYENSAAIQTQAGFNIRLAEQPSFYSFRENEERFLDPNANLIGYQDGLNVRTERADIPSISYPKQGVLALPARSVGGACLDVTPVRFLRERTSECVHSNVLDMCREDSMFSARMFAESTSRTIPPCPESYRILEQYGGSNIPIVNTFVSYYCALDDSEYVRSSLRYTMSPTERRTFPQELSSENCSIPCDDTVCLQYNVNQETPPSLPPRCFWDNGVSRPPAPFNGSSHCNNTVVDVRYLFTWEGQKIVRLDATVILAPVRKTNVPVLTQTFDVKFQYNTSTNTATDNYSQQQGAFERSGKPGYDYGKPLITGCSSNSDFVNMNTSRQMAVFQPGADGLCYSASRRHLTFGEDVSSSCKLRLDIDTINNCTDLRQLILNHLSVMMPSDVIGRQGNNDPFNASMWVSVVRDIPDLTPPYFNITNITSNINGTNSTEDIYQPVDNLRGICYNITSGINLIILYGEAGQTNGYRIREVVGARVSYTKSHWKMSCEGPNTVRCENGSQYVESFMLTSTVTFVKVPASTPEPVISFYKSKSRSCTTDSCYRYYLDFDQSVCRYDACMRELLYPLTKSYGADPPMYTLAVSLAMVLFGFGYFMISRPWF